MFPKLKSLLFVPGSNEKALAKVASLPASAVILDLEDSVAPAAKEAARENIVKALKSGELAGKTVIVRINRLGTEWGADDARALFDSGGYSPAPPRGAGSSLPPSPSPFAEASVDKRLRGTGRSSGGSYASNGMRLDAIMLPKVESPAEVSEFLELFNNLTGGQQSKAGAKNNIPIFCNIETAKGVLAAREIAAAEGVAALVMGINDLSREIGVEPGGGREAFTAAMQMVILAARAAGIKAYDGVYNNFKDAEGLKAEASQGRKFGFDGKCAIHPDQLVVINEMFSPSDAEKEWARKVVAAFEQAKAEGRGVAVADGVMLEELHYERALEIMKPEG